MEEPIERRRNAQVIPTLLGSPFRIEHEAPLAEQLPQELSARRHVLAEQTAPVLQQRQRVAPEPVRRGDDSGPGVERRDFRQQLLLSALPSSVATSIVVSRMPSGSKTCLRMNTKNGAFAAASTAALTRIQP